MLLENPPKLERLNPRKTQLHQRMHWQFRVKPERLQEKRNVYTTSRSQLVQCMLGKQWLGYYLPSSFAPECVSENQKVMLIAIQSECVSVCVLGELCE